MQQRNRDELKVPLLDDLLSAKQPKEVEDDEDQDLLRRAWIESRKLWRIVGPAIFSRLASYSMLVITQAFAGHLGDLELAGISIANNVIVGFDFGLLVLSLSPLHYLLFYRNNLVVQFSLSLDYVIIYKLFGMEALLLHSLLLYHNISVVQVGGSSFPVSEVKPTALVCAAPIIKIK